MNGLYALGSGKIGALRRQEKVARSLTQVPPHRAGNGFPGGAADLSGASGDIEREAEADHKVDRADGGDAEYGPEEEPEVRMAVEADETETGLRKTLNLGHTAAHAIERCSDYTIPHGHAVAIGLAIIARASERLGWATEPIARRVEHALTQNGLPTKTDFTPEALAEAALSDKKRAGGQITLVMPKTIGDCALVDIPVEQLIDVFRAGMEAGA